MVPEESQDASQVGLELLDVVRSGLRLLPLSGPAVPQGSTTATLLEAIEALRPPEALNSNTRRWRTYRLLRLRYVEGLTAVEAQRELSISKSQYYREHEAAISDLVQFLAQSPNERVLSRHGFDSHGQGAANN